MLVCLSGASSDARNARVAFGRIIAADYRAATRQIALVLGQGYRPGTAERGLFDMMATGPRPAMDWTAPSPPG